MFNNNNNNNNNNNPSNLSYQTIFGDLKPNLGPSTKGLFSNIDTSPITINSNKQKLFNLFSSTTNQPPTPKQENTLPTKSPQIPQQKSQQKTQQQKKIEKLQQQNKQFHTKIGILSQNFEILKNKFIKFQQNQQKNKNQIQNLKNQIQTLQNNIHKNQQNFNKNQQNQHDLTIINKSLIQLKSQLQFQNSAINFIANNLKSQTNLQLKKYQNIQNLQFKMNSNFNQLFKLLSNHSNIGNQTSFVSQNIGNSFLRQNPMSQNSNQFNSIPNNFFNQAKNQNLRNSEVFNHQNQWASQQNNQSFDISNNNFQSNLKNGFSNPMAKSAVFSNNQPFKKSFFRDGYEIQQSIFTDTPALQQVGNQFGRIIMINNKDFHIHPQQPIEKYFKIKQNVVQVMNEKLQDTYKIRLITYNFMNSKNIDPSQKDAFQNSLISQIAADKLIFEYWDRNTGNLSLLTR